MENETCPLCGSEFVYPEKEVGRCPRCLPQGILVRASAAGVSVGNLKAVRYAEQCAESGATVVIQPVPGGPRFEVTSEVLAEVNQKIHDQWVESIRAAGVLVEEE